VIIAVILMRTKKRWDEYPFWLQLSCKACGDKLMLDLRKEKNKLYMEKGGCDKCIPSQLKLFEEVKNDRNE